MTASIFRGNLRLAALHLFDPLKAAGLTVRVHVRLPDGESTLVIDAGAIDASEGLHGQPDVRIDVTAPDYIRLLQPPGVSGPAGGARSTLDGDPVAWGALLGCFDGHTTSVQP